LTSHNVTSLRQQFREKLPESVRNSKPVEYAVHVFGLENSILAPGNGSLKDSGLISELNFEREALFHDNTFITIIWADKYIFEKLRMEAGDLWDWITYKFKFTDDSKEIPAVSESEPLPRLPKGHIPERKKRIDDLKKKYKRLKVNRPGRERIRSEKINIQKLLGQEYLELNNYEDSKKSFKTALLLANQINSSQNLKMEILFRLGEVYFKKRDFDTSLKKYEKSLQLQINNNINTNLGGTYHQMGMVFQVQRKWKDALTHYQTAIDWNQKTDNLFAIGSTYHQMGMVFAAQQKWNDALTHYQTAIDWKKKTDNLVTIGNTYHQMGMVFEEQQKWNEAFICALNALQYDYEIQEQRDLIIGRIKELLLELSPIEAKNLFAKHFSKNPPERKQHCRVLIWNGQEKNDIETHPSEM
jgi:tetratricopeptide (TPR) repeat protein